jgi:DNA-binding MarR family transcriptional regulator
MPQALESSAPILQDTSPTSRAEQWFKSLDRLRRAWQGITPCDELSKSQFATLMVLRHGGRPPHAPPQPLEESGMTLTALAGVMQQSMPALSKRVHTLEAMGYVTCLPDAVDRRVMHVHLTPEGDALLQRAKRQLGQTLSEAMQTLSDAEMAQLLSLMERMTLALEAVQTSPASKPREPEEEREKSC